MRTASAVVIPHPHFHRSVHRPSTQTRLTVPSKLSIGLPYICLCHLVHKRSRQRCLLETMRQFPALEWMLVVVLQTRTWQTPIRPQIMATVKMSSTPLTSMESYQSNTTGHGRDGRKSGLSFHHEVDMLANESFQYYCSVEYLDLEPSLRSPGSTSSNFSGRSHSYPRTSLVTLFGIPRHPSLTAAPHLCSAPLKYRKISRSTVTMTSGSIGTSFTDIVHVGGHTEKRLSDLSGAHIFKCCKI